MLSMMDRLLNIPMKQLVNLISIDPRIREALLGSTTAMGKALELCRYHEHGGNSQDLLHSDEFVLDSASYYFEALAAAGTTLHSLQA
jgi:c-di-GMP-related signal transduction protein